MLVLRQESELVLKSRWVFPEKLLDAGFEFGWPRLQPAIAELTRSW
jgi:NAD dependent epimerase/dehydratase family enzyme